MENYGKYLLGGLFAITIFTRFFAIGADSLWLDEGLSIRLAAHPFDQIFAAAAPVDHNPPLFLYLLHFWLNIFGTGEIAARSFSALCSIAAFPLIWLLARRLFDKKIALLTLLIFAISPFQVYYAQETRSYALLNLLSLASVFCFLEWLRNNRKIWQIALLAVNILLVYSHIFGWFIVLFENLWWLYLALQKKPAPSLPNWLILQGLTALAFLPYALHLMQLVLQIQKGYWINPPEVKHFLATFIQFGGSISLGIFAIIFALLGVGFGVRSPQKSSLKFLMFWMLTPILVPITMSLVLRPFYLIRYPIAAAIPFYMLAAIGVARLPLRWRNAAIVLLIGLGGWSLFNYYSNDTRAPWRNVATDIGELAKPDDLLLIGADFCKRDVFDYYGSSLPQRIIGISRESDSLITADLRQSLISTKTNIYFIASHFGTDEKKLVGELSGIANLVKTTEYPHRDLFGRKQVFIRVYRFTAMQSPGK
ncbi:MAG: glycosyltransferase family 39 protein [Calditrichae bacterium]|nr:glycosyltransferase family 39 protein [Calditrichia bacterium]